FEEVDTNTDYMFKFAANGAWDINWGVVKDTEAKLNEANPAQYNAEDNIQFNVESEDDICNVTLRLDLTKWDTIKKGGATYTILVNYEPTPVYGDVDGDGFVTAVDATAIQKYSIDMPVDDNFNVVAADVNGDGRVSILDVTCVQKYVADFKTGIGRAGQPIELV
ncbi:MAG: dockerin type I repeat-containing protein, partial [Ruminococcus sp.]|nr:dockerin type I repeat-containing protein [Ruminococcus sp.]